jgi:hypothetical protein
MERILPAPTALLRWTALFDDLIQDFLDLFGFYLVKASVIFLKDYYRSTFALLQARGFPNLDHLLEPAFRYRLGKALSNLFCLPFFAGRAATDKHRSLDALLSMTHEKSPYDHYLDHYTPRRRTRIGLRLFRSRGNGLKWVQGGDIIKRLT